MPIAPPPPDRLAIAIRQLVGLVITRRLIGLIPGPLATLLIHRVQTLLHRFSRLAEKIGAGTFVPRRVSTRRVSAPAKPRQPSLFPRKRGWLPLLVPEVRGFGSHLENFLAAPDVQALLAAAPAEMARILRPLCWMLRAKPPSILAPPRRKTAPARPAPTPPRPTPPRRAKTIPRPKPRKTA